MIKKKEDRVGFDFPIVREKEVTFLEEDWRGRLKVDHKSWALEYYDKETDEWNELWLEPTIREIRVNGDKPRYINF